MRSNPVDLAVLPFPFQYNFICPVHQSSSSSLKFLEWPKQQRHHEDLYVHSLTVHKTPYKCSCILSTFRRSRAKQSDAAVNASAVLLWRVLSKTGSILNRIVPLQFYANTHVESKGRTSPSSKALSSVVGVVENLRVRHEMLLGLATLPVSPLTNQSSCAFATPPPAGLLLLLLLTLPWPSLLP